MLSYSGLVNYGKATLPSVEGWAQSANIIRDPPKSVHTRRVEKVFDTNKVTETLAESDDRFCEAISYYAKGRDPMIGVNYGGKYPYRIMDGGAFRPPIWRLEDLTPLSRMPRNMTSAYSCKNLVDYSRHWYGCSTKRETRDNPIKTYCEASKSVQAQPSLCRPLMTVMLKDPLAPGIEKPNKCLTGLALNIDRYDDLELRRKIPKLSDLVNCNKSKPFCVSRVDCNLDKITPLKPTRDTAASYEIGDVVYAPRDDVDDKKEYKNLPPKLRCESFDGCPIIPSTHRSVESYRLKSRKDQRR